MPVRGKAEQLGAGEFGGFAALSVVRGEESVRFLGGLAFSHKAG